MNKTIIQISLITTSLFFLVGIILLRLNNVEATNNSWILTRLGPCFMAITFLYFTYSESIAVRCKDEPLSNRVISGIRIPMYFSAAVFLFYLGIAGTL
jgi:hypothetical protein